MISDAPVLTVAPADDLISVPDAKLHLRVDHAEEDTLIADLIAAAVQYLDGWSGVLGRAIMPQTWVQEFSGWGDLALALPDVGTFSAVGKDSAGADVVATSATLARTRGGWVVSCDGGAVEKVVVTYQCGLPETQHSRVRAIVKLLVGHWYENREAVGAGSDLPMGAQTMISSLRWMQL